MGIRPGISLGREDLRSSGGLFIIRTIAWTVIVAFGLLVAVVINAIVHS